MNQDAADLPAIAQPDIAPGLACIGGFVDAIAERNVGAHVSLPRTRIQDVRVGNGQFQCSYGRDGLTVEDGSPGLPGVAGFPDSPAYRAEIVGGGARNPGGSQGTAAAMRSNGSPVHAAEHFRGNGLAGAGNCIQHS